MLAHLSYECPGLHGPGSRMTAIPRPFTSLFLNKPGAVTSEGGSTTSAAQTSQCAPQIYIPLFQRRYCWERAQLEGWWKDVLDGRRDVPQGHNVGKIIFKRLHERVGAHGFDTVGTAKEVLLCIDGQQRITTSQLLIAAFRDAALELARSLKVTSEAASRRAEAFADQLERVMHRDMTEFAAWRARTAAVLAKAGESADWGAVHPAGVSLAFSTLVPSFCDRQAFYEHLTLGRCRHDLLSMGTAAATAAASKVTTTSHGAASIQGQAKAFFDVAIQQYIERFLRVGASDASADRGVIAELERVAGRALSTMIVMFVEIHNEINLAQVFLWLQEKTLFGMGAILWNPTPGIDFHASDMARNLVMSAFMHLPMAEQEQLYRKLWLEPLELRHGGPVAMDKLLKAFTAVQDKEEERAWVAAHSGGTKATSTEDAECMPPPPSRASGDGDIVTAIPTAQEIAAKTVPRGSPRSQSAPDSGLSASGYKRYVGPNEVKVVQGLAAQNKKYTSKDMPPILVYAQFHSWYDLTIKRYTERAAAAGETIDVALFTKDVVVPKLAAFAATWDSEVSA